MLSFRKVDLVLLSGFLTSLRNSIYSSSEKLKIESAEEDLEMTQNILRERVAVDRTWHQHFTTPALS